ncbi:helix-turn-helix domain-containing protein [Phascolarctobacterium sp. ET69]|uniref:helix-turn-helix domain-containing protein n=1 Tax=Phascolarctobacterium sp. ET69 TaxID=2939420 RepID=UPI002012673A|nr:helix-turn-helix transcriptional regulator [Phascolarctobacterium sp. ET69]MCL1605016.1 helix-turn-helix domain-containing protein [Phascolarctobacterium sp. ET69]
MFALQYKKLGARIVYYRKINGLTQEKLAEEVGISPQYLSRIENGNYPKSVSLSTLMRIAEKLNVSISKLLEDIENK